MHYPALLLFMHHAHLRSPLRPSRPSSFCGQPDLTLATPLISPSPSPIVADLDHVCHDFLKEVLSPVLETRARDTVVPRSLRSLSLGVVLPSQPRVSWSRPTPLTACHTRASIPPTIFPKHVLSSSHESIPTLPRHALSIPARSHARRNLARTTSCLSRLCTHAHATTHFGH